MRRRVRLLSEQRRELGLPYALLNAVREAIDRLLEPLDGVLLRIEGRRGVLGPAHRRYRGQTALDNRELWSGYDWSGGGLEWGPAESRDALVEQAAAPASPSRSSRSGRAPAASARCSRSGRSGWSWST